MSHGKRRWWLLIGLISVFIIILPAVLVLQRRAGIHVTVENSGGSPLKAVVLHVTQASYRLGDIAPGATVSATVQPGSESHLEIEFKDAESNVRRLDAGGYFEPGDRGTIHVSIRDGQIDRNEQNIGNW